jgi:hypothetical protein
VSPSKVPRPELETLPKFVTQEWLDKAGSSILKCWKSDQKRKPPTALVRCSRGGKTRALSELASEMACGCDYIGFVHDFSNLNAEEQLDPVGALCRRIAFAADSKFDPSKDAGLTFDEFREFAVTADEIRDWLGQTPCVLLIDELNNLNELAKKESETGKALAEVLKKIFLNMKDRYLVFSSHVVTTGDDLSAYMEDNNERKVDVVHLAIADK